MALDGVSVSVFPILEENGEDAVSTREGFLAGVAAILNNDLAIHDQLCYKELHGWVMPVPDLVCRSGFACIAAYGTSVYKVRNRAE